MDDPEQMDSSRCRNGALSVSRSSKIANRMKRPAAAAQRPPPAVFKTEPEGFRNLVQKLTGAKMEQPLIPEPVTARATNVRLQRIAPVPLRPISSRAQIPPSSLRLSYSPTFLVSEALGGASTPSQNQYVAPVFPPLTFSPLAALTPSDSIWAAVTESPLTAHIRQVADQLVAGNEVEGCKCDDKAGASSSIQSAISPAYQSSVELANQMDIPSELSLPNAGMHMSKPLPADLELDFTHPGPDHDIFQV
ncbi:hypothetical protein O6H91_01G001700 [Diphasiastrum complanatum]|uniref:Uncharacterized protein n=1 Tax=Diphasiastrum complanatum TaxID=34168 RepID=A0ACC2EM99_DIPCM|nr:hypothetical protein O6H91_01G001700 [Diphasiastrum complanatum]